MQRTPKSLRLHIAIFGRRNVGKSSLLNAFVHQEVSIVSDHKGTTTDPIEKTMELLPLGPVVLIDTAGLDDEGDLGGLRVERTLRQFDRCDMALIVTDNVWGEDEKRIHEALEARQIPHLAVLNKCDLYDHAPLLEMLESMKIPAVSVCAHEDARMELLYRALIRTAPAEFAESQPLLDGLVSADDHLLLVIPIDKEAPKGRLIAPQVQTIRAILDAHARCSICSEQDVGRMLETFREPPKLVITDSQAFGIVSPQVPPEIMLTGFSILFARFKGELCELARGAAVLSRLQADDRVLIAEACTHHPIQDDIGRVKIPGWLHKRFGDSLRVDVVSGQELPPDLSAYRLVIHCGACMWTRRQMLERIRIVRMSGAAITNYGMAIAGLHGILERALEPFPDALEAWRAAIEA